MPITIGDVVLDDPRRSVVRQLLDLRTRQAMAEPEYHELL
jgi:hypothetical protein